MPRCSDAKFQRQYKARIDEVRERRSDYIKWLPMECDE